MAQPTRKEIGQALRRHRAIRRVPQSGLAEVAGITQASVSNYEHGKRDMPLSVVLRIADAWGLTVEQLLTVPDVQA